MSLSIGKAPRVVRTTDGASWIGVRHPTNEKQVGPVAIVEFVSHSRYRRCNTYESSNAAIVSAIV